MCAFFFGRPSEGMLCGGFLHGMASYSSAFGAMPGQGLMGTGGNELMTSKWVFCIHARQTSSPPLLQGRPTRATQKPCLWATVPVAGQGGSQGATNVAFPPPLEGTVMGAGGRNANYVVKNSICFCTFANIYETVSSVWPGAPPRWKFFGQIVLYSNRGEPAP